MHTVCARVCGDFGAVINQDHRAVSMTKGDKTFTDGDNVFVTRIFEANLHTADGYSREHFFEGIGKGVNVLNRGRCDEVDLAGREVVVICVDFATGFLVRRFLFGEFFLFRFVFGFAHNGGYTCHDAE